MAAEIPVAADYEGGQEAMYAFIAKELKYPLLAKRNRMQALHYQLYAEPGWQHSGPMHCEAGGWRHRRRSGPRGAPAQV
ncbi:MAG: hypothetical protein WKG07_33580 [Hymenobacter sp.]